MANTGRIAFLVETVVAALSASLAVLTSIWPDWIELILGFDPDRGDGSLEWVIAVGLGALALLLGLLARYHWRKLMTAGSA